jgi:hypothetical protein
MDPSFEDPSSPTTAQDADAHDAATPAAGKFDVNKTIKKSRPKKTDEEDLDFQTAGIKR